MDKISELKEKLCRASFIPAKNKEGEPMTQLVGQNPNGWGKHSKSFNKGFSAAMELQLPVKFALWMDDDDNWLSIANNRLKIPQLFDYWLENIYEPEK